MEVRGGKPKLLTTRSLPGQIQALRQEIEAAGPLCSSYTKPVDMLNSRDRG